MECIGPSAFHMQRKPFGITPLGDTYMLARNQTQVVCNEI